jgi:asparagine synthase (glutamine-hydrolysing)
MTHVAEQIPLYQLFTAPSVVECMWALPPADRGGEQYAELLEQLPGPVAQIPDAKLGTEPLWNAESVDDELSVTAHRYGTWLRTDLRDDIIDCIRNGPLVDKLCNSRSMNQLFRIWPQASTTTMNRVDDVISWLASLSIFVETYDITIPDTEIDLLDFPNAVIGPVHAAAYQTARDLFRK